MSVVADRAGWEHISQFIAQATRAKDPFSKEDCIAKYQQIHAAPAGPQKIVAPSVAAAAAPASAKSAPERPSRREPRVREREREKACLHLVFAHPFVCLMPAVLCVFSWRDNVFLLTAVCICQFFFFFFNPAF